MKNTVSYLEAIAWIAIYDDNEWLKDKEFDRIPSVTASMVCELFDVPAYRVEADLITAIALADAKSKSKRTKIKAS
jgi:hypothetical protein